MRRRIVCSCLLALAAAGCKEDAPAKPSGAASASASATTVASCAEQSKVLGAWMKAANSEGMGPPAPFRKRKIDLVARSDGDPWAWFGAALLVDADAVQLDFDALGPPGKDETKGKLEAQLKQRAKTALAAGISMGIDVYLDDDTSWEAVVSALSPVIATGFRTAGFVFQGPSKVEPPKSPLLAKLMEADEARRKAADPLGAPEPASPAIEALSSCRAVVSIVKSIGKRELTPKEKNGFWSKRAPGAWQSCRCRGSQETLEALQWHWLGRSYGPPTRSFKVLLSDADDAEATSVKAPKSAPWKEVADKVVQAAKSGKRVALVIE